MKNRALFDVAASTSPVWHSFTDFSHNSQRENTLQTQTIKCLLQMYPIPRYAIWDDGPVPWMDFLFKDAAIYLTITLCA